MLTDQEIEKCWLEAEAEADAPESEWLLYGQKVAAAAVAAERERWQRIAANAQAVTTGGEDKLDYFEVPSYLMAALALALDEGPNAELTGRAAVRLDDGLGGTATETKGP